MTRDNREFFGKADALMVGGMNMMLIIAHHLFGYPWWLSAGVTYDGGWLTEVFGGMWGVCSSLAALTTGYVAARRPELFASLRLTVPRALRLYTAYWLTMAAFLIVGFAQGTPMPGAAELGYNLLALGTSPMEPWMNVPFAWYTWFFLMLMLAMPALIRLYGEKRRLSRDIALTVVLTAIGAVVTSVPHYVSMPWGMADAFNYCFPLAAAAAGIMIGRYDLAAKAHTLTRRLPPAVWALGVVAVAWVDVRAGRLLGNELYTGGCGFAALLTARKAVEAAVLGLCLASLAHRVGQQGFMGRFMTFTGQRRMYVWYAHGIFFTGAHLGQQWLYSTGQPLVIWTLAVMASVAMAAVLASIHTALRQVIQKL